MKTLHITASALLLFGILAGCARMNKDESLTARVVEYGTHKPIPKVGVVVHYRERGDGLFSGRNIPYDSVVSDAQGLIFLDGSEHNPGKLRIYTHDTSYYDNWPGGGPNYRVYQGFKQNPLIELYPFAWARLRFIKKSDLDYIGVSRFSDQLSGSTIYTEDTIIIGRTRGNTWKIITLYPYKNSQALPVYHDSVFTPGHDTTYYEIEW